MTQPVIQALGEAALMLNTRSQATLKCQQRIWALAAEAALWPHVLDVVPGMNNLTLLFDPLTADADALATQLQTAWNAGSAVQKAGRLVEIPVTYGGEFGPDLHVVAAHSGLSAAEVVRRHSTAEYLVYFLGFQPGFAYLGGLDPQLATPRRSEPRLSVPAGSVAIGGAQTVGSTASVAVSAPITVFDPRSCRSYGDQVQRLGRSLDNTVGSVGDSVDPTLFDNNLALPQSSKSTASPAKNR